MLTKINELRNIPRLSNTAVICISQSRLEDSVLLSEIPIDNYSILYCDWNGHGGGVVCYIKNDINSFFPPEIENVFFELLLPNTKPINAGIISWKPN